MVPKFGLKLCQGAKTATRRSGPPWDTLSIRDPFCLNGFDCSGVLFGPTLGTPKRLPDPTAANLGTIFAIRTL